MSLCRILSRSSVLQLVLLSLAVSSSHAQTWTQYGPPPRFSHSGVFDPVTKAMIVFGGQNSSTSTNLNDVWLVSTSSLKYITATQLSATGTLPSARYGHIATYDSASNRMTVFGGGTGSPSPCLNDVWILDGANGKSGTPTWLPTSPSGKLPAARYHHTGAYDASTNTMIVFGGSNCAKGYFNDVWVLSNANGSVGTPSWKQLSTAGSKPTARESASSIYDPVNNILTIYGGNAGSTDFGDVWTLSNANGSGGTPVWTQLTPSGTPPMTRTGHSAIYDSANNRMTIYGGFHSIHTLSDTFVLTSPNGIGGAPAWVQVVAKGTAPQVSYHSAAYDSSRNSMYIFAGSSSEAKLSGDDHAFSLTNSNGIGSSSWTRGGPPARYSQSMFYDSITNSVFVLDGQHALTNTNFDDYWQTNNVNNSSNINWTPVNVAGTHPKSRWGQSAAYDITNNRVMMFAGSTGFPSPCMNDYWVMTFANNTNGKKPTWSSVVPTGTAPLIRTRHSAAYDPTTNSLIVFGGFNCNSTYYNDVWVLSGANALNVTPSWNKLSPVGLGPSIRQSSSAVYNTVTNTLTIFGGDAGGAPFGDIWVLSFANGVGGTPAWTEITPSNNGPSARSGHTATYDSKNDLMTVYGGYDGTSLLGDTWVLSSASGQGTSTWTQITPTNAAPARRFASATYDPVSNQMNIFGGVFTLPSLPDDHLFSFTHANGAP
jgi:hypothetical protein